jgi:hypothetical protein
LDFNQDKAIEGSRMSDLWWGYEATAIEESSAKRDQGSDEYGGTWTPLAYNPKRVWSFVPDTKKNDNVAVALANAGMQLLAGAIKLHDLVEDAKAAKIHWSVIEVGGTQQDEKRLVEDRLAYFIVLEALKKMETMTSKEILDRLRSHSQKGATAKAKGMSGQSTLFFRARSSWI